VGVLGKFVICHIFWFRKRPFFISFFLSVHGLDRSLMDDFDDLCVMWRVSAQGCAFFGLSSSFRMSSAPNSPILRC